MASHPAERGGGKGEGGDQSQYSFQPLDAESVAFLEKEMAKFRREFNLDKDALREFVKDRHSS